MSHPKRIQLQRTKGWRLADVSDNAVVVDRRNIYGNPFRVGGTHYRFRMGSWDRIEITDAQTATALFREWVDQDTAGPGDFAREHVHIKAALDRGDLRGKDLACWCPLPEPGEPDFCHGAYLIVIANGGAS